jgi:hypothetical protein
MSAEPIDAIEHLWDDDPALRDALEYAGWRYATLIGVVAPSEEDVPLAVREEDRARFPHMIRRGAKGLPIWDVAEAETFVHEITGAPRAVCAAWMGYDWPA